MNEKLKIDTLQACLVAREELPLRYAAMIALQAANEFDERLIPGVQAWMDEKLTPDFSVEDCSIQDIMDDTDASLFEALCMLNMQIKHPEWIEQAMWVLRGDGVSGIRR